LRSSAKGPGKIQGYAASYNVLSSDLGGFFETLAIGAFRNAIRRGDDAVELLNHNQDKLLGRRSAGTLSLREDDTGLWYSCELPDTSDGRDVRTLVERGDLNACSFSFRCDEDVWTTEKNENGDLYTLRTVKDLTLYDCSVVVSPAYPNGTSAMARNLVPESVLQEARSFHDQTAKRGILTQKEIDLCNLRHRAQGIQILMDEN
jgi:HK97 family phage prohead protease